MYLSFQFVETETDSFSVQYMCKKCLVIPNVNNAGTGSVNKGHVAHVWSDM